MWKRNESWKANKKWFQINLDSNEEREEEGKRKCHTNKRRRMGMYLRLQRSLKNVTDENCHGDQKQVPKMLTKKKWKKEEKEKEKTLDDWRRHMPLSFQCEKKK